MFGGIFLLFVWNGGFSVLSKKKKKSKSPFIDHDENHDEMDSLLPPPSDRFMQRKSTFSGNRTSFSSVNKRQKESTLSDLRGLGKELERIQKM